MPHKDRATGARYTTESRRGERRPLPPDRKSSERRGRRRHPFWAIQRIAPGNGARVPQDSEFFEVRCFDLSRTGFSFLLSGPPAFDTVVVELGGPCQGTYVAGQIVHWRKVIVHPSGELKPLTDGDSMGRGGDDQGIPMMLIGVRFLERVLAASNA